MNHRLPAAVFLTAAALSAIADLLGGPRESAQAGAVALLALAGWAVVNGRGAARWSLPAGLALLALATILTTRGYAQPSAVAPFGNGEINRDRTIAAALLLASLAFLLAVRSLPGHPPSRLRSQAALLAAAVPVVVALTSAADDIDRAAQIIPLIGGTALAWAATFAAAAVAGVAVLKADTRFLLPAGALVLAGTAALTFMSLTGASLYRWNVEHPGSERQGVQILDSRQTIVTRHGNAAPSLTQTGATINVEKATATAYVVAGSSGPDPWSAAAALLVLVGPTLLTAGATGGRSAPPDQPA
jgi:hypothetical protein